MHAQCTFSDSYRALGSLFDLDARLELLPMAPPPFALTFASPGELFDLYGSNIAG
jgi:hypothetical protein